LALVEFTTYEDVRAALGVSSDELEDATLDLSLYEFNLKDELSAVGEEISPTADLITDFKTADGKAPALRSTAEQKLVEFTRLFSTYVIARHCASTLPIFSPKEQHDGKASIVRYASSPYEVTIRAVTDLHERYRARLRAIYASFKSASNPGSVARTYLSVVAPSTDPVTGS
jgi:hypothetical protein